MDRTARISTLLEMLKASPGDLFLNYALGLEYMGNANLREAEQLFKKTIEQDENYTAAYYQLGKLFEAETKNAEALDYYRAGLEKARQKKDNKSIHEFEECIFLLED